MAKVKPYAGIESPQEEAAEAREVKRSGGSVAKAKEAVEERKIKADRKMHGPRR